MLLLSNININSHYVMMALDVIFLILVLFLYSTHMKEDFQKLKEKYTFGQIFKIVILSVISLIILNMLVGILGNIFNPSNTLDENTISIQNMAAISIVYTVFKTMIFGSIAEEILFRESLSECLENNLTFVLVSAVIYTVMNFVFTASEISITQLLAYFLPALLFSYIYIKNDRNIIIVMIVKFVYNLIPLTILLLGI